MTFPRARAHGIVPVQAERAYGRASAAGQESPCPCCRQAYKVRDLIRVIVPPKPTSQAASAVAASGIAVGPLASPPPPSAGVEKGLRKGLRFTAALSKEGLKPLFSPQNASPFAQRRSAKYTVARLLALCLVTFLLPLARPFILPNPLPPSLPPPPLPPTRYPSLPPELLLALHGACAELPLESRRGDPQHHHHHHPQQQGRQGRQWVWPPKVRALIDELRQGMPAQQAKEGKEGRRERRAEEHPFGAKVVVFSQSAEVSTPLPACLPLF